MECGLYRDGIWSDADMYDNNRADINDERTNTMETEHNTSAKIPDQIYPELVTDDFIKFFSRYDGKYIPEDIEELNALSEKLTEFSEIVYRIYSSRIGIFYVLLRSLNAKAEDQYGKSRYELTAEEMTINDVFITIFYPFFTRWGGSWEARFALEGMLIKYLKMYREKIETR